MKQVTYEYELITELVKNKQGYSPVSVCMANGSTIETTIHDIRNNPMFKGLRGTIGSFKPLIEINGAWKKGAQIKHEINVLEGIK